MDNLNVVNEVVDEHVDLGVALSPFTQGDVRQIELCSADLICVVHESSPLAGCGTVSPQDLAEVPLISFRKTLPLGLLVNESFKEAGVTQKIALEVNQSSVACALARSGAGAAIIDPFWLLDNHENQLIRLELRPRATISAQALVSRNTNLTRPARLFLAALRETADELRIKRLL